MKWYLKQDVEGWDFRPVGKVIDQKLLDAGFIIVKEIPQSIKDKMPGGKDWIEPKSALETKIEELEQRIIDLEVLRGV